MEWIYRDNISSAYSLVWTGSPTCFPFGLDANLGYDEAFDVFDPVSPPIVLANDSGPTQETLCCCLEKVEE